MITNRELERLQEVVVACFMAPALKIPGNLQTPFRVASAPNSDCKNLNIN